MKPIKLLYTKIKNHQKYTVSMALRRINLDELDNFIEEINSASDLDKILLILQEQIQIMGFDYFTYWLRWPSREKKEPVFISTYPKHFIDHYVSNDYQSHDLVGRKSIATHLPFSWSQISEVMPITRVQKKLFDASRSVGMVSGGSVPIHGPQQVQATFSVANDWNATEFNNLFLHHRHQLQILATYAHEKIMQLGLDRQILPLSLSKRETEILTWCSRGKSYWEIGAILNISENTVRNHMQKIFANLEVHTASHAIAKAIINGLVIP